MRTAWVWVGLVAACGDGTTGTDDAGPISEAGVDGGAPADGGDAGGPTDAGSPADAARTDAGCTPATALGTELLRSTLDDAASIRTPLRGDGSTAALATSPPGDFVPGRTCDGVRIDGPDEYLSFPQITASAQNFEFDRGTLDFWYLPSSAHTDDADRHLFGTSDFANGGIRIRKASRANANNFQVIAVRQGAGGMTMIRETNVAPTAYAFTPGTWVRITVTWDFTVGPTTPNVAVYFDGAEVASYGSRSMGPLPIRAEAPDQSIFVGAFGSTDANTANGVIDELAIHAMPVPP